MLEKSDDGFIFNSFKAFCLDNEEEVLKWGTSKDTSDILKRVFHLTEDTFDEFINENWKEIESYKNEENANKFRNEGNELYKKKRFNEAIRKYTQATLTAPLKSEALALAFANRSAVLCQQENSKGSLATL